MKRFLCLITCLFIFYGLAVSSEDPKFVVVIDAGHGGKDGGAVRGIYKEKEINLGVATILGELIEDNFKDVKVVYTRKKDVFVDLNKRADIANKAKANLFISIHTNSTAAKSTTASGADTYILGLTRTAENLEVAKRENSVILLEDDYTTKYQGFDPNSPESYIIFEFMTNKHMEQSLKLAEFIQKDFKNVAKRTDRGVRQAGFLVLRESGMPSVLIELGFINNPVEAKFLASRLGQRAMATAIYSGFKNYKRDFDKRQGRFVTSRDNGNEAVNIADDNIEEQEPEEIADEVIVKEKVITSVSETTKAKKEKGVKNNEAVQKKVSNELEYRVQFLVSPTKLANNSPLFKGLSPVDYYQEGSTYKYTFGSTSDQNEIIRIQRQVRQKFKDAFVIKFRNGSRIK
ncbi:MAG: N-acetylmuramoyl-L-alanine amidase [Dysgonomonas sp.]